AWRELEEESGATLLELGGLVDHGDTAQHEALRRALPARGIPVEPLPAAEAQRRWPGMRFESEVLHYPQAGTIRADAAVSALWAAAGARGAELQRGRRVTRIEPQEDEVVVEV